MSGRRILITGGGSGIGLTLARALAPANRVVVAGRDAARLEAVAGVERVRLDVTSEESAAAAVTWIEEHLGGLDVLINSAGVFTGGAFDQADAGADLEVNLAGAIRMTRLALPLLRRSEDGAVVFLSSALALVAVPGMAVYGAGKAAVHSLARSLRDELAGEVKVFDVLPPWVDTGLADRIGGAKVSPDRVARDVVRRLERDRFEIRIGRIRALAMIARISPRLADRIVARSSPMH